MISKTIASRLKIQCSIRTDYILPSKRVRFWTGYIREYSCYQGHYSLLRGRKYTFLYLSVKLETENVFGISYDYLLIFYPIMVWGINEFVGLKYFMQIAVLSNVLVIILKRIYVKRSARQRCRLSFLLCVNFAEPPNLFMENNQLNGIHIKRLNITTLICQHIDDNALTLVERKFIISFDLRNIYCKAPGQN